MKRDNVQPEEAKLSKPELVWRAIEELGYRAEVSEILEFVRAKYGLEQAQAQAPVVPTAPPAPVATRETPVQKTAEATEPARKPASQRKPRPRQDTSE